MFSVNFNSYYRSEDFTQNKQYLMTFQHDDDVDNDEYEDRATPYVLDIFQINKHVKCHFIHLKFSTRFVRVK